MQMTSNYGSFSDFWLKGHLTDIAGGTNSLEYINKLASTKRAITNFVKIVTDRTDINVRYSTSGDSYTDGKNITISSDATKASEFDAIVGLALHEASHIKLTDFTCIKKLNDNASAYFDQPYIKQLMAKHGMTLNAEVNQYIAGRLHQITNILEDRRIDHYIFTTAPGYFGYYQSLYNKYFNAEEVDQVLIAKTACSETWEDYLFHLCNMTNKNRDLSALKNWTKIWNLIDLKNIERLQDTKAVYKLGVEIFKLIEENAPVYKACDQQKTTDEFLKRLTDAIKDLTPDQLKDILDKQKQFIDGEVDKKSVDSTTEDKIQKIDSADVTVTTTGTTTSGGGKGKHADTGNGNAKGVETYVIKHLTKQLIDTNMISGFRHFDSTYADYVTRGIQLGTMLGRRLQVRDEVRTTVNSRQEVGKIDKRLINSLGYNNEKVFYVSTTEQFNAAMLHISIDASGSMQGTNWKNTIIAVTAICKACSMIGTVGVTVNFRWSMGSKVAVVVAYDSRKDKFNKIPQLFPCLHPTGSTPESLCYEAIRKVLDTDKVQKGVDNYFINFSDGEPGFSGGNINYNGQFAVKHCRNEIELLKKSGYKVLSYFINDDTSEFNTFKQMYGPGATMISVTEIVPLARTLNEMLKQKNA